MRPETNTVTAADRNKDPILQHLRRHLPGDARVLEIASGSGTHVVHFAAALPLCTWQPSDPDAQSVLATAIRCEAAGLRNIRPPLELDVHQHEWHVADEFDAVLCINMVHIAPWSATQALFAGARRVLRSDGPRLVILYGPYKRGGQHTAPSNAAFDESLRWRNAAWGVRDLESVTQVAAEQGFACTHVASLPANNLLVVLGV